MKIKEQKKYFYIFFFVLHPDRIPSNITVITLCYAIASVLSPPP